MSSQKMQLRDAALEYLLQHGAAKLSLRPLAANIGTSPRMLMFYFKSKEALLQDVLQELNTRLIASLRKISSADRKARPSAPIERFWRWTANEKNFRYLRLLYEVQIIAIQNPSEYGSYLRNMSTDWQAAVLEVTRKPLRTAPIATLCIAVFDGLFLELMSTGDRKRLTQALNLFISLTSALPSRDVKPKAKKATRRRISHQ